MKFRNDFVVSKLPSSTCADRMVGVAWVAVRAPVASLESGKRDTPRGIVTDQVALLAAAYCAKAIAVEPDADIPIPVDVEPMRKVQLRASQFSQSAASMAKRMVFVEPIHALASARAAMYGEGRQPGLIRPDGALPVWEPAREA